MRVDHALSCVLRLISFHCAGRWTIDAVVKLCQYNAHLLLSVLDSDEFVYKLIALTSSTAIVLTAESSAPLLFSTTTGAGLTFFFLFGKVKSNISPSLRHFEHMMDNKNEFPNVELSLPLFLF